MGCNNNSNGNNNNNRKKREEGRGERGRGGEGGGREIISINMLKVSSSLTITDIHFDHKVTVS